MDDGPSKARIAVYAALGIVLLLLGIDAFRGDGSGEGRAADGEGRMLAEAPIVDSASAAGGELVVHVAGAVADPGVYTLSAGSRVADAIKRAGGGSRGALLNGINLAARLADGQQVVVPSKREIAGPAAAGSGAGSAEGPISLGSADATALESIDGIGPVTAAKILEFRDQNGGVGSVADLDQIPGIGPATLESLSSSLQP